MRHPITKRGKETQDNFFSIFEEMLKEKKLPDWIKGFRRGTEDEDHQGIDGWVELDIGEVPIQIKSSAESADRFRNRRDRKHIICVISPKERQVGKIFRSLIIPLGELRSTILLETLEEIEKEKKARR